MKVEDRSGDADDVVHDSMEDVSDARPVDGLDAATVEVLDLLGIPHGRRVVRLSRRGWAHVDHVTAALFAARVGGTSPCGVPAPRPAPGTAPAVTT